MPIEIVRVERHNAACLDRIAIDVFDAELTPAFLNAYLSASHHALFVAISQGEVVGQARGVIHFQPDLPIELYIDNLGVTPTMKRQGIATQLVQALIDWAQAQGADTIWLGTEIDNAEAKGFYDSFGFERATMAYYFTAPSD